MYSDTNKLFNNGDTETYLKQVNFPNIFDQRGALCENAIYIKAVSTMNNAPFIIQAVKIFLAAEPPLGCPISSKLFTLQADGC